MFSTTEHSCCWTKVNLHLMASLYNTQNNIQKLKLIVCLFVFNSCSTYLSIMISFVVKSVIYSGTLHCLCHEWQYIFSHLGHVQSSCSSTLSLCKLGVKVTVSACLCFVWFVFLWFMIDQNKLNASSLFQFPFHFIFTSVVHLLEHKRPSLYTE